MKTEIKKAVEKYQCAGCVNGRGISCFLENPQGGVGCGKHYAGTLMSNVGKLFLGMPKGFNRLGDSPDLRPTIYETLESSDWGHDMFNVPVWKFVSKEGHTFVRGIMPRLNEPFLHVFLENCADKIDCLEITQDDLDNMD